MSGIATAIVVGGVVAGGATYLASENASDAAGNAANTQLTAAQQAEAGINKRYEQSRQDLYGPGGATPWAIARAEGMEGFAKITEYYQKQLMNPKAYRQTGQYQNTLRDTEAAMLRGASAGGRLDEGGLPDDFGRNAANISDMFQGNYLQRIAQGGTMFAQQAGLGTPQATASASLGQQAAGQGANALIAGGNAAAGGYINQANATTGLYSNLANTANNSLNQYMQYKGMQNPSLDQNANLGNDWANTNW